MATINLRNVDEGVANALTEAAKTHADGSREALIKQILADYVRQMGIPRKGYIAYAENGAEVRLLNAGNEVLGTTTNGPGLSRSQITALRKAELMAQPKNGSRWAAACKLLESVGLEVFEL